MRMQKKSNATPNERDFIISYHIRELRETKYPGRGGGQKCADAMGVPRPQYYHWENATRTPRLKNLDKVAEFFGKPIEHFYEKPDGWEYIYPKMLRLWRQRVGASADVVMEDTHKVESETSAEKLPTTGQALRSMDQMNSIIKHLLKKQLLMEEGQLDPGKFEKALDELYEYTVFKLPN
jgi:transcriptional regulator with XRE-family HTH domain